MHRALQPFQPSAVTVLGGMLMALGSLVYLSDSIRTLRNVHWFMWASFLLMAIGAVIALVGTVVVDREPRRA